MRLRADNILSTPKKSYIYPGTYRWTEGIEVYLLKETGCPVAYGGVMVVAAGEEAHPAYAGGAWEGDALAMRNGRGEDTVR